MSSIILCRFVKLNHTPKLGSIREKIIEFVVTFMITKRYVCDSSELCSKNYVGISRGFARLVKAVRKMNLVFDMFPARGYYCNRTRFQ